MISTAGPPLEAIDRLPGYLPAEVAHTQSLGPLDGPARMIEPHLTQRPSVAGEYCRTIHRNICVGDLLDGYLPAVTQDLCNVCVFMTAELKSFEQNSNPFTILTR